MIQTSATGREGAQWVNERRDKNTMDGGGGGTVSGAE